MGARLTPYAFVKACKTANELSRWVVTLREWEPRMCNGCLARGKFGHVSTQLCSHGAYCQLLESFSFNFLKVIFRNLCLLCCVIIRVFYMDNEVLCKFITSLFHGLSSSFSLPTLQKEELFA